MDKIQFLNTFVNNCTMEECIIEIERLIAEDKKSYVVPVNVDVIVKAEKNERLKKIIDNADIVLVDGKPLIWIAKKHKKPITEKVSGSDLVPELCKIAEEKGYSVYILGGKKGVAAAAGRKLEQKFSNIKIAGTYEPEFGFEKNEEECRRIIDEINAAKPDILLVCLGCPKQEQFVYDNIDKYSAKVSICAGATVDFLAGRVKRAPKWMRNHGLEWFYRFLHEPFRLFKRYFIDDLKIIKLSRKYRKQ